MPGRAAGARGPPAGAAAHGSARHHASPAPGLQHPTSTHHGLCPPCRTFFLYALTALPAATMLPLALRFPGRPQMLLVAGALLRSLLHPAPRPVMVALWVVSGWRC